MHIVLKRLHTSLNQRNVYVQKPLLSMMGKNVLPATCLNIGIMIKILVNLVQNSNFTTLNLKNAPIALIKLHSSMDTNVLLAPKELFSWSSQGNVYHTLNTAQKLMFTSNRKRNVYALRLIHSTMETSVSHAIYQTIGITILNHANHVLSLNIITLNLRLVNTALDRLLS